MRKVRDEIQQNIHFTPKETDIYRIHQSGDLANLDGLEDSSLKLLPSLLTLRDAMYSSAFRKYIASVTNSGPLSGLKTDMAVNVYTPGCHLLCHDDVIGSRRVSYILYLLDPDRPWKAEWGGALRLYPTETFQNKDGTEVQVPTADFSVTIPPAFNQLSFFTVQPGESFHDVEEVYHRSEGEDEDDGGRVRMAISGWFHIPQEGEEGYEEGLEDKMAERSSLQQLQGKSDKLDLPQPDWKEYEDDGENEDDEETELTTEELTFLLRFMTPQYLTPDTVEQLNTQFEEESSIRLTNLLSSKFSARLREYMESVDGKDSKMPANPNNPTACGVSQPPYKHRYQFRQPSKPLSKDPTPYDEVVDSFFPSLAFRKWLTLATGLPLAKANILARRFRRGMDYSLATSYDDEDPQLEVTLGLSPAPGWSDELDEEDQSDDEIPGKDTNGDSKKTNGKPEKTEEKILEDTVGGYELYMAADEEDDDAGSDDGVEIPNGASKGSTATGAGKRRKADPAVYRSNGTEDDDGVLFSMPAGWNTMSIVLRDKGVLRFVKYVSAAAKGDRWDISGEFQVVDDDEDNEGPAAEKDQGDDEDDNDDDDDEDEGDEEGDEDTEDD